MLGLLRFVLGGALWWLLVVAFFQLPGWFLYSKNEAGAPWEYVWRFSGEVRQVPPAFFQSTFTPYLEQNFWQVRLPEIYALLAAEPWFAAIRLERRWPPEILVTLGEKSVVAFWDQGYLSADGEVFHSLYPYQPGVTDLSLPRVFSGWRSSKETWEIFLRLQEAANGLPLLAFIEDERGSWEVFVADGLRVILGQEDQAARFKTFILAYQQILRTEPPIAVVDMRYRKGFSVTWREENRNEKR